MFLEREQKFEQKMEAGFTQARQEFWRGQEILMIEVAFVFLLQLMLFIALVSRSSK